MNIGNTDFNISNHPEEQKRLLSYIIIKDLFPYN